MTQPKAMCVVLLTVLLMLFRVNSIEAADSTVTIYRGQVLSKGMSAGDTWTVYYNPDGTFPTFSAVEPLGWWLALLAGKKPTPVTAMSVYIRGPGIGWQWLGNYQISPWTTTLGPLFGARGTQYKFVIKNYVMDTPVYVQVK